MIFKKLTSSSEESLELEDSLLVLLLELWSSSDDAVDVEEDELGRFVTLFIAGFLVT